MATTDGMDSKAHQALLQNRVVGALVPWLHVIRGLDADQVLTGSGLLEKSTLW